MSDRIRGTAFDRALNRACQNSHRRFLFFWNRGLGDIALGIVPLFERIRRAIPAARIAVITRRDLVDPFLMTSANEVHALPGIERESRIDISEACRILGLDSRNFEAVFDYPDPNRWLHGWRREFPPRLNLPPAWADLHTGLPRSDPGAVVIGAHVCSETARFYGYTKDWPEAAWRELLGRFRDSREVQWMLFGSAPEPRFDGPNVTDLRGRTDFPTLVSLIHGRCRLLIAPDSGVLTTIYYLDAEFPIDVVSLWSDPRQGVLLQDCDSPNSLLRHVPLIGPGEDVRKLEVDVVDAALRASLAAAQAACRPCC